MTRLGPGWLCQPKVPPGAIVFCSTWRSEAPLVLSLAFQAPVLTWVSIASKRPVAMGMVVTPEGGVACAGRMISAAPMSAPAAAMAVRVRLRWTFIAAPFVGADGRLGCCRLVGDWSRRWPSGRLRAVAGGHLAVTGLRRSQAGSVAQSTACAGGALGGARGGWGVVRLRGLGCFGVGLQGLRSGGRVGDGAAGWARQPHRGWRLVTVVRPRAQ